MGHEVLASSQKTTSADNETLRAVRMRRARLVEPASSFHTTRELSQLPPEQRVEGHKKRPIQNSLEVAFKLG